MKATVKYGVEGNRVPVDSRRAKGSAGQWEDHTCLRGRWRRTAVGSRKVGVLPS